MLPRDGRGARHRWRSCLVFRPRRLLSASHGRMRRRSITSSTARGDSPSATAPTTLSTWDFVAPWVSRAFDLGAAKYGVLTPTYGGDPFYLTVYLPGAETALTSQGLVRMACCYPDEEGTTHAEIHYLTPAAWEGTCWAASASPPEYYHPHYLTHETVHFFQWACCRDDADAEGYRWPTWLTEGMAESDGYRHTTEYSRTTAVRAAAPTGAGRRTRRPDLRGEPSGRTGARCPERVLGGRMAHEPSRRHVRRRDSRRPVAPAPGQRSSDARHDRWSTVR